MTAPAGAPAPSVGHIVHFKAHPDGKCVAAIIADVIEDDLCWLTVFPAGGSPFPVCTPKECCGASESWHWPERV